MNDNKPQTMTLHSGRSLPALPSAQQIGDPVWVTIQGHLLGGHVRAVTFTSGKVRYAISLMVADNPKDRTTLHNVDSAIVGSRSGDRVAFDFDNYS